MRFFTPDEYNKLLVNGRVENRDKDHLPVVKLYLPGTNCTWLINEIYPNAPQIAFGLCDLGLGFPELGNVSLAELLDLSFGYGDISVEVDLSFEAKYPISVYATAAFMVNYITDDETILEVASTVRKRRADHSHLNLK